jgi:FKBP-type peptidyl-prolyl cis-trans isomerase SlyD
MADNKLTVADDMVVGLAYTLRLEDGEVVDSSEGQKPLEFLQGYGQIVDGLEQALYGMTLGEEKDIVVAPEDGYGEVDTAAFEKVPLSTFPQDMTLEPGMELLVEDESGQEFEVYVAEVGPASVLLDFNHPLAGETLYFHAKIASLRAATDEELAHRHVHAA